MNFDEDYNEAVDEIHNAATNKAADELHGQAVKEAADEAIEVHNEAPI